MNSIIHELYQFLRVLHFCAQFLYTGQMHSNTDGLFESFIFAIKNKWSKN